MLIGIIFKEFLKQAVEFLYDKRYLKYDQKFFLVSLSFLYFVAELRKGSYINKYDTVNFAPVLDALRIESEDTLNLADTLLIFKLDFF